MQDDYEQLNVGLSILECLQLFSCISLSPVVLILGTWCGTWLVYQILSLEGASLEMTDTAKKVINFERMPQISHETEHRVSGEKVRRADSISPEHTCSSF